MKLKFVNTILFVKDIKVSKQFYADLLEIKILHDWGEMIVFENHFAVFQGKNLLQNIYEGKSIENEFPFGKDNLLAYFISDNLEESYNKLKANNVTIIHDIKKLPHGEKAFRFYDPDGHIVEIGEG